MEHEDYDLTRRQVNASFQAHFIEPSFDLFKDLPSLLGRLHGRLSSYGLRLSDTKFETGNESLAEVHLRCFLFDFRTTLRIYIDRIEQTSTIPAGISLDHESVARAALDAVLEHMPELKLRAYTVTIGLHGVPVGRSAVEFLSHLGVFAPQHLGPLFGAGAIFYYGAALDQLVSSITVDLSRVVENGLFFQTNVIYDAQQLPVNEAMASARKQLDEVLRHFKLSLVS